MLTQSGATVCVIGRVRFRTVAYNGEHYILDLSVINLLLSSFFHLDVSF